MLTREPLRLASLRHLCQQPSLFRFWVAFTLISHVDHLSVTPCAPLDCVAFVFPPFRLCPSLLFDCVLRSFSTVSFPPFRLCPSLLFDCVLHSFSTVSFTPFRLC